MKKIFFISSLFTLIFFVTSCTKDKGELIPIQTCVSDSLVHTVDVTINDDFFSPQNIEIIAGDTVRWTYPSTGASIHTTTCDGTSGTIIPAGGITWDSGNLSPNSIFKKSISVAGNYSYICVIHGSMMTGNIVVKPRCN